MTGELCPRCSGWRRASDDRFCGICGTSFVLLDGEVRPAFVFRGQETAGRLDLVDVQVTLRNNLDAEGTGIQIVFDSGAQTDIERLPHGEIYQEGDSHPLKLNLPPKVALPGKPESGRLIQVMPNGEEPRTLADVGYWLPRPTLDIRPSLVELPDAPALDDGIDFAVVMHEGLIAPIGSISVGTQTSADNEASLGIEVIPYSKLPTILRVGEHLSLRAEFSEAAKRKLISERSGTQFYLFLDPEPPRSARSRIDTDGNDRRRVPRFSLPFSVRIRTPANPSVISRDKTACLLGRTLMLNVTVENSGGSPCTLDKTVVKVRKENSFVEVMSRSHFSGENILAPGKAKSIALHVADARNNPWLVDSAELRFFQIIQHFVEDDVSEGSCRVQVDVRAPQDYRGRVSIDFGTAETAVAVWPYDSSDGPRILRLGEPNSFVPTVIAYYLNETNELEYEIGEPAKKRALAGDEGTPSIYFDNLKWQMPRSEYVSLPNGEKVTWSRIASDYLRALKQMIENHPDVAAMVSQAYVTRPARFGFAAVHNLRKAFQSAGIEPVPIPTAQDRAEIISESWSPSVLALHLRELERLRMEALQADHGEADRPGSETYRELGSPLTSYSDVGRRPNEEAPSLLDGAVGGQIYRLLTIDVGGGSTDLSLFVIDYNAHNQVTLREISTEGDNQEIGRAESAFCGNGVSRLLFEGLRSSLDDWLLGQGIPPVDVPIHLPWEMIPEMGVSAIASRNGLAVARVLYELQNDQGPFNDARRRFIENIRQEAENENYQEVMFSPFEERGARLWAEMQDRLDERIMPGTPLELVTRAGRTLSVPWGKGALRLDVEHTVLSLIREFYTRLELHMREALQPLMERRALGDLRIVISGRGALFPLIPDMVRLLAKEIYTNPPFSQDMPIVAQISRKSSKSITAIGASFIANTTISATGIRFLTEAAKWIGVVGEPDETGGRRVFHALFDGPIHPGLQPRSIPWQFPAGPFRRELELVQASADSAKIEPDHPRLGRLGRVLDIEASDRGPNHLIAEVPCENCLRFWIGVGGPQGPSSRFEDFDFLHHFGDIALVEGACEAAHPPETRRADQP